MKQLLTNIQYSKENLQPRNKGKCPRCKKLTLTKTEKEINEKGKLHEKTVCKKCRGQLKLKYKKDRGCFHSPKYEHLPNKYKWHYNSSL